MSIELPEKWESVEHLYGMPLLFLGPISSKNEHTFRPTISITDTGIKEVVFLDNEKEKNEKDFKKIKDDWLIERQGSVIEYLPYRHFDLQNGEKVRTMGVSYTLNGKSFVENTYYIDCKKTIINFKSIYLTEQNIIYGPIVNKILMSFQCKK